MKGQPGRREFLKAAAMAVVTPVCTAAAAAVEPAAPVPVRVFGKTGVKLPVLGYGGAALVKAWGSPLPVEDRVKLVRTAFDRGLRYFDTAGNYMESQAILGEGLQGVRDRVFLVTKVETTDPAGVRGAVERSLRDLRTDHLDAILVHGTPGIEQMTVARALEIHGELVRLRDEGIARFIGLSAHGYFDKALALIESGGFDLCMLSYGYLPRGSDQVHSARMIELRNACLARAHALNMGIAAMKVVGAGLLGAWAPHVVPGFDKQRLAQLPGAAIRWALNDGRIDLLVIGMRLAAEVDANLRVLSGDTAFTVDDRALLAEFCAKAYESETIRKMRIE